MIETTESKQEEIQIEKSRVEKNKLTLKQESFAQSVVKLGCYSKAYKEAYDAENMSSDSVKVEASRLMAIDKINRRVEELRDWLYEENNISMSRVMAEMSGVAFTNILDFFDEKGDIKHVKNWDFQKAKAIVSVDFIPTELPSGTIEFRTILKLNVTGKNAMLESLRKTLPSTQNHHKAVTITHKEIKALKIKIRAQNEEEVKRQEEKAIEIAKYKKEYKGENK